MSILLTPFANGEVCSGSTWTVENKTLLAEQVARIALGYSRHIKLIVTGAGIPLPASATSSVIGALDLLSVVDVDPSHRNGWLFQTISYIAALTHDPTSIYDAPHMQHTAKGFDGLKLEISATDGTVKAIIIFEDKATTNPRNMIANKKDRKGKKIAVWDEFEDIESGNRQPLLTDKISSLLQTVPNVDVDQAIENIIWKKTRGYRVSITVGHSHSTVNGRARLFRGYEKIVPGDVKRRRAETLHLENLRDWLDELAEMAKSYIRLVGENV